MAFNAVKTEHAGPKHCGSAYWGPKTLAKQYCAKERRRADKAAVREMDDPALGLSDEDIWAPAERLARTGR